MSPMSLNQRNKKALAEVEESVVPDSTTIVERSEFCPGQDILLKHKDGRYYFGTVVSVDNLREQCLVKFGDNTDNWSNFKDLVKLSTPEREDLLCVLCKKSSPKNKKEITVCDKCGRGYHQKCHMPEIPVHCMKEDSAWMCKRCLESEPIKQRKSAELKNSKKDTRKKELMTITPTLSTVTTKQLPYDPELLSWDTYHRVNLEQKYCYCGEKGDWYTQMLQCGRCRQWFHEKCISCLKYPLYCGDRFYVYVCTLCNEGSELVRRLELNWIDLVHLMLFNLTAFNSKKYYDLDTIILPYINDNWHALQLPPKVFNISKSERRVNVLSVLTNNRNRFKCGREIKKRVTIWGLRIRLPPPAPCITLSLSGKITEDELKERWHGNRRLQFLPYPDVPDQVVPVDLHMLNLMMGTAYHDNHTFSETESPCPSPELPTTLNKKQFTGNNKLFTDSNKSFKSSGCVKKSVPFPKISLKHKKRLLSLNIRKRDKILRRQKRKGKDDNTMRRITRQKNIIAPLTPPTSVSAPPTPPTSGSSNQGLDATDYSEHSTNLLHALKKDKLTRHLDEFTPCDTSGDETSSKSTLDLIIPPPKDFEGKNNPFLTFLRGYSDDIGKKRSKDSITLPLPLTAVIPGRPVGRPYKRKLSQKDICIGPNGQVKRKRLKRSRSGNLQNYGQTASKTATVVPVKPDANDWNQRSLRSSLNQDPIGNCVDYALNGRRLRQRNKSIEKEKKPPTPKPSPAKQEPVNMDELKSSVHSYFGSATRILDGERFTVKAKRYGPTGKLEYLMEWDGVSNVIT